MANGLEWLKGAGKGRRAVRALFTSAGRRIELIEAFTRAARGLALKGVWHSTDIETHIAAGQITRNHRVPDASARSYITSLLKIVRDEGIDLVIPLIDSDLPKLARARERFQACGCGVLISSPEVVDTCRDKVQTFQFLKTRGIDSPRTWTAEEIRKASRLRFPCFLKPRFGSASKGNFVVSSRKELDALLPLVPNAIIQEFITGIEYTLDVYTGFDGRPRCVVPRERIEVRGGEVTKARTVKDRAIIEAGLGVAEALTDCVGLITIQLILTPEKRIRVIEINPRFGGGVPLAIQAGADFPKWLLGEWLGRTPRIRLDHFKDRLMMMRYHQAFFAENVSPRDYHRRIVEA